MIGTGIMFVLLSLLPVNFRYAPFAFLLFLEGVSMGSFASPNRAAVMNSLPGGDRGAGAGMNATFQNSAQVLSIGIFFSLMIVGLASKLPATMAAVYSSARRCRSDPKSVLPPGPGHESGERAGGHGEAATLRGGRCGMGRR